jgi:hypothetical protein
MLNDIKLNELTPQAKENCLKIRAKIDAELLRRVN